MQYLVTLLLNLQDMIDQRIIEENDNLMTSLRMLFTFILLSLISSVDLSLSCLVTWQKKVWNI